MSAVVVASVYSLAILPVRRKLIVGDLAGQAEVEVVRHHQEVRGLLQLLGMFALQPGHLIDRVEDGLLDARARVVLGERQNLLDLRVHSVRTRIAVGHHVGTGLERFVQQDEIDAPRVDADRRGNLAGGGAGLETGDDVARQRLVVPAVVPVLTDLGIVETIDFLQHDPAVFKMAEDVASRGRADVDCEMIGHANCSCTVES